MYNLNYGMIVDNIYRHYGEKLNDWETDFIDSIMNQNGNYTGKQKEVILKINRKYLAQR